MNIQFKNLISSIKNLLIKKVDNKNKLNFITTLIIILTFILSSGIIPLLLVINFVCIGIKCLLNAIYSEIEKLLNTETPIVKIFYIIVFSALIVFRYVLGAFVLFFYTIASSLWQIYSYLISLIESNERHKFYCPYKDNLIEYTNSTLQKDTL